MPKLATGIWTADAGFTLLEVLVTLALIGILTGLAVLSITGFSGTEASLEREVQRLAARLEHHRDEAVLLSDTRGLWLAADRYQFLRRNRSGDWQMLDTEQRLMSGASLVLSMDERTVILNPDAPPQIWLTAVGEVTPFVIELSVDDSRYQLSADIVGRVQWQRLP